MYVQTHIHPPEARSQNLLTDMPVKGKFSCLRSYKNPWECQTSGILHLAWEEMDKGPGAARSRWKLEAVISLWNTNHLRKKKKPKSWPLSPKKFIVYLSCLNITLCPISQPSFLPSPFWGLVFVSFSFLFSIFILLKMSPGPRTLSGADGCQKILSQSKSLVGFSCTI